MIYLLSKIIFGIILKLFFKFEVTGIENVPKSGPFIIASNHVSYADPVVVGVALPRWPVTFMAKKEIYKNPILRWWVKAVRCIPVERNSGSYGPLKQAIQRLKKGEILGIFPEGTRSADGRPKEGEPGIGLVAMKTEVPVIPIYLSGTDKALPKGRKILTPCKVKARIGKGITFTKNMKSLGKRKVYKSISKQIMDAIFNLSNE